MSHENADVLQRELVEATQALNIVEAALRRAATEHENAKAQAKAAQAKVEDLRTRHEAAVKATREAQKKSAE